MWSDLLLKSRLFSIIYCSSGLQDSSHPHPICLFLCEAQCSYLRGCTLIVSLLACLDLVQTKHGWQQIVVNCLVVWGTTSMSYLSRPGEKKRGRAYLFAEPWPLWARDVQLAAEILRGWMVAGWVLTVNFSQGAVCVSTQKRFMFAFALASDAPQFCGKGVESAGPFMMHGWTHNTFSEHPHWAQTASGSVWQNLPPLVPCLPMTE